ncbi:MAG: hypothetical protein ACRDN0_22095 [Trebonia sp.]
MSVKYEIVLGPAANRLIPALPDRDRKELAEALRTELSEGPNADKEVGFDVDMRPCRPGDVRVYTGTPLSFDAYVAVHRPLTRGELKRLGQEQHRRVARAGFLILDILHPASGFTRGPLVHAPL